MRITKSYLRKLINEEVAHFLFEAEEEEEIKKLLKATYPQFVQQLGSNINDPKFVGAMKSVLASTSKINLSSKAVPVKNLIPTQNEIAADKSLLRPLTDTGTATSFLKGGTLAPGGPIISSGGGKYVIDGHHRWSQIYVINPNAKVQALDISNLKNPFDALKATQIGIAADIGKLPSGKAGGVDLIQSGKAQVKSYVISNITEPVVEVFKKFGKGSTPEEIADYIWSNVESMQKNNKPIAGAPKRDIMPQTGDAPGWAQHAAKVDAIKEAKMPLTAMVRNIVKKNK